MMKIVLSLCFLLIISISLNIYQLSKPIKDPFRSCQSIDSLLSRIPIDSMIKNYSKSFLQYAYVDTNTILNYPDYNPEKDPPMPITTAISLAKKTLFENSDDYSSWELINVKLQKGFISKGHFYKNKWLYIAEYSQSKGESYNQRYEIKRIPIYFAGVKLNKNASN